MNQIKKVNSIKFKNKKAKEIEETVVNDETIIININNKIQRRLSGIIDSLKEFSIGYLIGEGMIKSTEDIESIEIKDNVINIKIKENSLKNIETVLCSDSGGGWRTKISSVKPVNSEFKVHSTELINRIEELKDNAKIWQATGGTHVAGIVYEDKFIIKEDVSRHVAVDKVIGYGALNNFDFSKSYVIYSGRMPADMVIKLTRAGIPILASNAAPSNSGCEIAEKGNITLVGFLRGERFNVYGNTERIVFDK